LVYAGKANNLHPIVAVVMNQLKIHFCSWYINYLIKNAIMADMVAVNVCGLNARSGK
jgi:hypothetical protein